MINKNKLFLIQVLFMFINFESFSKENMFVVYNVNNEIITNIDIKKESRYLMALNSQLKNLEKQQILKISKDSALREMIKEIELSKYVDFNKKNLDADAYIRDYYKRLKLNSEAEFKSYLDTHQLTLGYFKKKIQIEIAWNQLIYERYRNQVNINTEKLKKDLEITSKDNNKKMYQLSEIVFEKDDQNNLNKKIKDINKSIENVGFRNTANIYSISDSAKFGGDIGWIEEIEFSTKILEQFKTLEIGQHTKAIQIGNSFLILKVEKIKNEKKEIDKKKELEIKIRLETTKQLNQFSKIYYNKVKINTNINEL